MVPVEVTAFGLLALCAILLAVVLAVQLLPWPLPSAARVVMWLILAAVVILALYSWATTRIQ